MKPSLFVLAVSSSVLLFDQTAKYLAQKFLALGETLPVIPHVLHLTLWFNDGAAFGLFQGAALLLILFSFLSIIVILFVLKRHPAFLDLFLLDAHDPLTRLCLGLVLGGACGNLIDRLRYSYVVDFIDFRIWPIFNIADSAITVGGLILLFKMLKRQKEVQKR